MQAFRRGESISEAARLPLHGLDAEAQYAVTNFDTHTTETLTGKALLRDGLRLELPHRPDSVLIQYHRIDE